MIKLRTFTMAFAVVFFLGIQHLSFAQEELPVPEPAYQGDGADSQGDIPEVNPQAQELEQAPPQAAPENQQRGYNTQNSGQPQARKPHKKFVYMPNPNKWSAFFTLGTTFSPSSSYDVTVLDTTTTVDSTGDRGNVIFGGELNYRFIPWFQLGGVLEYTKYQYQDTTANSDSELLFLLLPRTQIEVDMFTVWFGLGLGLERTGIGTASASSSGTTATVDSSFTGFAFSPRLGADYEINESFMLGMQLTYTTSSGSLNGSVGNTSTAVDVKEDVSRKWFAIALRVGTQW